jgi:hypothetical protein
MFVMFLQDNMVSHKKNTFMKNLKFLLTFVILASIASIQMSFKSTNEINKAVIEVQNTTRDFGKIPQGKPVTAEFTVKNTGKTPLVMENIQTSCGCTLADFTRTPIAPNQTGYVKVTYNANAVGSFTKTATITSNAENKSLILTLKGEVVN